MTKTMTAAEFRKLGLLQEINRRVLHPIGLALAVEVEEGTGHVLGIADELIDHRDDLEGMIYPNLDTDKAEGRARWFDMEEAIRHPVRRQALGYVVQPIGGQPTDGWRSPDDHPDPGTVGVAQLDPGDNTGAGLDEVWAIVYWDGKGWTDVNGAVMVAFGTTVEGVDISPWMVGWQELVPTRPA